MKTAGANRLERYTLLHIPRRAAVTFIVLAVGLTALLDHFSPQFLWFGPAYLAAIAFTAWAYSSRVAIMLGLFILVTNALTGDAGASPFGSNIAILNIALKFFAVLGIVLLLGAARRALEREWQLARTDQLTGSLNRLAFFDAIASDGSWRGWSVLIYADLDGLKSFNDNFGHEYGDRAMVAFANRIRSAIREDDLFARIGGDEFVVFMNVRDEAAGIVVANRLNQVLNVQSWEDDAELRASLGVLLLPAGSQSIDAELKATDTLMYEAKRMKIGMLIATGHRSDDGPIELSRHIAEVPPANRRLAIRSQKRSPHGAADQTGFSNPDKTRLEAAMQSCPDLQEESVESPMSETPSPTPDEKGETSMAGQKAADR